MDEIGASLARLAGGVKTDPGAGWAWENRAVLCTGLWILACVRLKYDFENRQLGHDARKDPRPTGGVCRTYHVVQAGEGLFAIGARYGVSPQDMLNANPWVRKQPWMYVYKGQKVCIP